MPIILTMCSNCDQELFQLHCLLWQMQSRYIYSVIHLLCICQRREYIYIERSVSKVSQRWGQQFNIACGINLIPNRGMRVGIAIASARILSWSKVVNRIVVPDKTCQKSCTLKRNCLGNWKIRFSTSLVVGKGKVEYSC